MADLRLELPPSEYKRLQKEAARLGKSPQGLAQEWLTERLNQLNSSSLNEKEKAKKALRAAGLLTELSPGLQKLADPSIPLQEVREALSRPGDTSLSQIVIEQREPNV